MLAACVALLQEQGLYALKAEPEGSCCPAPWACTGPDFSHLHEKSLVIREMEGYAVSLEGAEDKLVLRGNFYCTWNSKNCPLQHSVIQGLKCTLLA